MDLNLDINLEEDIKNIKRNIETIVENTISTSISKVIKHCVNIDNIDLLDLDQLENTIEDESFIVYDSIIYMLDKDDFRYLTVFKINAGDFKYFEDNLKYQNNIKKHVLKMFFKYKPIEMVEIFKETGRDYRGYI